MEACGLRPPPRPPRHGCRGGSRGQSPEADVANRRPGRTYNRPDADDGRAAGGVPLLLRGEGPPAAPVGLARPARLGALDAPDRRGDAAADAVLPRPRAAAGAARDDRPE